jgi:hypothetical protein
MPTTQELTTTVADTRVGDEVWLDRAQVWATVQNRKVMNVNVDLTTVMPDGTNNRVRMRRDRAVKVRRVVQTPEEKYRNAEEILGKIIARLTPAEDAVEVFRTKCAERMLKQGPRHYLKWEAEDDAKAEHELSWWITTQRAVESRAAESRGELSVLETGHVILERIDQLRKEMTSWYIPQSTSQGSNLAGFAEWDAWKNITSGYGTYVELMHWVKVLDDLNGEIAAGESK